MSLPHPGSLNNMQTHTSYGQLFQTAEGQDMTRDEIRIEYDMHSHMACGLRSFEDYCLWRKTHPVVPLTVVPPRKTLWQRLFG